MHVSFFSLFLTIEIQYSYFQDGHPYLAYNKCDGHNDCSFGRVGEFANDNTDETNCDEFSSTTQVTTTTSSTSNFATFKFLFY